MGDGDAEDLDGLRARLAPLGLRWLRSAWEEIVRRDLLSTRRAGETEEALLTRCGFWLRSVTGVETGWASCLDMHPPLKEYAFDCTTCGATTASR